jgi:tRNA pseudouridine55 synthase
MDIDGILLLNKEKGPTSFRAIEMLKHKFRIKKIGHSGTLDPMAEGLLLVMLGNAKKISDYMIDTKEYNIEITFGISTNTDDAEGVEIKSCPVPQDLEKLIRDSLSKFTGPIMQKPPIFSAIKKDGVKLYEIARAGKTVEIEDRPVTISSIEFLGNGEKTVELLVACSSGTYMRSLARDLGEAIGTCAHLSKITRTKIGMFSLDSAHKLSEMETLEGNVLSVNQALYNIPAVEISAAEQTLVKNGNPLRNRFGLKPGTDNLYKLVFLDKVTAIAELEGSMIKIKRGIE